MTKLTTCWLALMAAASLHAQTITIPSDGSDGVFAPTANITVDLSLAVTGNWDDDNTANAGVGIYDPTKWAVVFKYESVNIPTGVTVTFANHPSGAPVMWLVQGNVVIDGTVNLNGANGVFDAITRLSPTKAGPGGFRGGALGPDGYGLGYGPGGGGIDNAGTYNSSYGNPQIIPLMGGSGGSVGGGGSGGGGGGAILIASQATVAVTGNITANGGINNSLYEPYGSGGAVRIISPSVSGAGAIRAIGYNSVSFGRIRIETNSLDTTLQISPSTIAVRPPEFPIIFPPDDAPTVRIVSVDGVEAPLDPTAPLEGTSDVAIQDNAAVQVVLETTNFPTSGVVQLRRVAKYGAAAWLTATYVSGDFSSARWVVNVTFVPGFSALQARATVP